MSADVQKDIIAASAEPSAQTSTFSVNDFIKRFRRQSGEVSHPPFFYFRPFQPQVGQIRDASFAWLISRQSAREVAWYGKVLVPK